VSVRIHLKNSHFFVDEIQKLFIYLFICLFIYLFILLHYAFLSTDLNPRDQQEYESVTPNKESPKITPQTRDSKYYDEMISRINEQLTHAVESGQSPYAIYGMSENDENEWC